MALRRLGAADLARLLDSTPQPIYVLDADRTIVFCNRSCLEWLGRSADEVQGKRCQYTSSSEEGADPVAAGLCPPPPALSGQEMTGLVGCVPPHGRLSRRRARFFPLVSEGSALGVMVLVEPVDLPDSPTDRPPSTTTEAAELHEQLRAFRHEMAGRYRMDRFVGDTPAMRRVRAQMELAAASRANVLVVGPPGSGRQHAAHVIHYNAPADSPGTLVPLACALLGADLIRSTLAAMASALSASAPCVPSTLLLNDVDQLAPDGQAELARLVATQGFSFRVIGTARRSLMELARQGEYREDLAAALCTLLIELPPLAERRSDVPLLAQMFVEQTNARTDRQVAGLTAEALDYLAAYPWPGNVDELAQVIREAHGRAEGAEITARDLPPKLHLALSAAAHPRRPDETIVLDEFLARIERELVVRALARAKGNKTKAAKLLGMTRPRLYRRLVQLGLENSE